MKSKHVLNIKHGKKCICTQRYIVQYTITSCYYRWYCTVLSLYCTCGSPNRKESSPNSSSTICCKLEPPPPSSPRPPRSCGLVPSSVQVQLPASVHRLTWATLCSFSSLLRAPKLTSPGLGSFFVPSSKLFPHLPTSNKHLVLWSGSVGGCIRDTVEADRGLGCRAERVRCFGLEFVSNIFCPEIPPIEALG